MTTKTLSSFTNDEREELEKFAVTRDDVTEIYPNIGGLWPNPTEATLIDSFRLLGYVTDDPEPEGREFGDQIEFGGFRREWGELLDSDGNPVEIWVWFRERILVKPDANRVADLKQQLREEAHDVAEQKLSAHFAGPHPNLGAVQRQGFEEVARYDARGTGQAPQPVNFPVLRYIAVARSRTLQQQVDDTRIERDNLWPKAGQIWARLITTLAAINGAATAPAAKAEFDAFAGFEPD